MASSSVAKAMEDRPVPLRGSRVLVPRAYIGSLGDTGGSPANHRQMSMKTFLPVLAIVLFCTEVFAREHEYWPYDRLTKEADMIVIAVPLSTRDTAEKTTLPGIW